MIGSHLHATCFVVSTGRTGTLALSEYLGQGFSDVSSFHEPTPSAVLRLTANLRASGRLPSGATETLLRWSRRRLVDSIRSGTYVEVNPYLWALVEVLPKVFHRPILVHIVRDPRTYVPSALNSGALHGLKWLASRTIPYWFVRPGQIDATLRGGEPMSNIERFSWGWTLANREISSHANRFSSRYHRVRFEDLFAPDASGLRRLGRDLGLREVPGQLRQLVRQRRNASRYATTLPWAQWPARDRAALYRHCFPLATDYGYSSTA